MTDGQLDAIYQVLLKRTFFGFRSHAERKVQIRHRRLLQVCTRIFIWQPISRCTTATQLYNISGEGRVQKGKAWNI